MNNKLGLLWALAVALITTTVSAATPADEGKSIFTSRCASCHNVNKQVTGPALAGVDKRRSIDWIIRFVHSSQNVVKSGDKDAVALFAQFNQIIMPDHPDLSDVQIKNIVEYIKSATVTISDKPPFVRPGRLEPNYMPLAINNYLFFAGYLVIIGILVLALLAAVYVKELQRRNNK
jgi:mono/diheme cytochrome c family protein